MFWTDALQYSVYIKNRTFNRGCDSTPYEKMFGRRPDIHHLRIFGSLAYAHIKADSRRHKLNRNATIGYILGHAEDVLGCKLYFPGDRTRKFVLYIRVNENVLYRDRQTTTATLSDANSDVNSSIVEGDYVAET